MAVLLFSAFIGVALAAHGQSPSYADVVLSSAPLAYWRLGESGGMQLTETSGAGSLGTYDSGVALGIRGALVGDADTAAEFDGVSGTASIPLDLSPQTAITLEFWLKWNAFADDDRLAFEFAAPNQSFQVSDGFLVAPDSVFWAGNFEVSLGDDRGETYNAALFPRPTAGEWHHYAFVLDRQASPERQITPYVDGQPVAYSKPAGYASQPHAGREWFGNGVLQLMSGFDTPFFGAGTLDDVAIYPGALTEDTIALHYAVGTQNTQPTQDRAPTLVPAASSATRRTFQTSPLPLDGPELANPDRGQYRWYGEPPEPGGWPFLDSYTRYSWRELEPARGQYDFSAIERDLAEAAQRRGRFGFRIMTLDTAAGGALVPEYLVSAGAGFLAKPEGTRAFVPDWNDELYLGRWEALLRALADRFGNDPRLGFLDIGGYGNYGEWWLPGRLYPGPGGQSPVSDANAVRIVDATVNAFPPDKHLLVIGVDFAPALRYALDRSPRIGIRLDCLGGGEGMHGGRNALQRVPAAQSRWQSALVATEWCPEDDVGTAEFVLGDQQVQQYHVSLLSSGNFAHPYAKHTPAEQAAFVHANKTAGYRFVLDSVTLPERIGRDQDLVVETSWENTGVAPPYRRWEVLIQLRDDSTGSLVWQDHSGLDLRSVLPTNGSPITQRDVFSLPGPLASGTYSVLVQVVDPGSYSAPLQLAIAGRQTDGSYLVGQITVSP
ncbi:MAG TPA: LamG-like jellyroll fold domain-containing protein [Chloroflexota bacterium]|jgi:hypothetical protein|nr:LamG-like jellyroll fold domain-containing protein [Chloroflexota bacterium]